jgi:hypothetical protein
MDVYIFLQKNTADRQKLNSEDFDFQSASSPPAAEAPLEPAQSSGRIPGAQVPTRNHRSQHIIQSRDQKITEN